MYNWIDESKRITMIWYSLCIEINKSKLLLWSYFLMKYIYTFLPVHNMTQKLYVCKVCMDTEFQTFIYLKLILWIKITFWKKFSDSCVISCLTCSNQYLRGVFNKFSLSVWRSKARDLKLCTPSIKHVSCMSDFYRFPQPP